MAENTGKVVGWQQPHDITAFQQMLSSCSGAILTSVFVTPLDVIKVRLQTQQKQLINNKCSLFCNEVQICCSTWNNASVFGVPDWCRSPHYFTGTMDAFIKISRSEGVSSLWSGLPPTLLMSVPSAVIYLTVYDQMRELMMTKLQATKQPLWVPVTAGGLARAFSAMIICPLEMIRTKMQSKRLRYIDIGVAVKGLVRQQGLLSMWRGLGPTVLRDVPFSSLYWANYESLKQLCHQEQPTFWFSFFAGALSGTIAAILTLPFDVIKTHRQIELGELEAATIMKKKQNTTFFLLKNLYKLQGFNALFVGIVPRVVKVAPACAIMISTYEFGKKFFHQYNSSKTKEWL